MSRRRIPWAEVAEMARRAGGVWRLHSSLVGADLELLRHARRRVPELRSTDAGEFEFARGNRTEDDLGRPIFDLYVRFKLKGQHLD